MRQIVIIGITACLILTLAACDIDVETATVNDGEAIADAVESVRGEDYDAAEVDEDVQPVAEGEEMHDGGDEGVNDAPRRLLSADDVWDLPVENSAGESLGEIEDMVINLADGQIALVTLGYGGLLGLGEKTLPMPLSMLRYEEETRKALTNTRALTEIEAKDDDPAPAEVESAVEEVQETDAAGSDVVLDAQPVILPIVVDAALILNVPDDLLATAPGYDEPLPDLTDPGTVAGIETFYRDLGEPIIGHPLRSIDLTTLEGQAITLSDLQGSDVFNPAGEQLGEIEAIMLDLQEGEVRYLVLSFGGFLGIGDSEYAVPFEAFEAIPAQTELGDSLPGLALDVSEAQLEAAPSMDGVDLDAIDWDLDVRDFWIRLLERCTSPRPWRPRSTEALGPW